MPKEQYILSDANDVRALRLELQRILDSIALRLNYMDADGDDVTFNGKKITNLALGAADSDAVRKDQIFLLEKLAEVILGTTNQVIVTDNGDETITLSTPQNIDTDADVEFDSAILDDLTASRLTASDANKKLISVAAISAWIAGTAKQITVTDDGDGTVTISIPDNASLVNLNTSGGVTVKTVRVEDTYSILLTDHIIYCDTDNKSFTVTLPAGVEGQHYKIINCGSNRHDLTITGTNSEKVWGHIDGPIADGDILNLYYNVTEGWW